MRRLSREGIEAIACVGLLALACVVVPLFAQPTLAPTTNPVDIDPACKIRPDNGLAVPCKVVSVHDGDTLTAEVVIRMNVRLLDCWAPELSEPGGKESRDRLSQAAIGRKGTLWVPIGEADNVADVLTFGRVLGHVWIEGSTDNLSQLQVQTKRAATRKGIPLGK